MGENDLGVDKAGEDKQKLLDLCLRLFQPDGCSTCLQSQHLVSRGWWISRSSRPALSTVSGQQDYTDKPCLANNNNKQKTVPLASVKPNVLHCDCSPAILYFGLLSCRPHQSLQDPVPQFQQPRGQNLSAISNLICLKQNKTKNLTTTPKSK